MKKLVKDKGLILGLIIGLVGGVMGNLFVASIYRMIDKVPAGHNVLTFFIGLIAYIVIIWLLFRALKK